MSQNEISLHMSKLSQNIRISSTKTLSCSDLREDKFEWDNSRENVVPKNPRLGIKNGYFRNFCMMKYNHLPAQKLKRKLITFAIKKKNLKNFCPKLIEKIEKYFS
jgi:hypothetical protein